MNEVVWENKCWGRVAYLNERDVSVSVLDVNAGFCCSKHHHERRWNSFRVITGEIEVVLYNSGKIIGEVAGTKEIYRKRLLAGETYDVAPRIIHRFEVVKSGKVVEIYWSNDSKGVDMADIFRLDVGGPIDGSA